MDSKTSCTLDTISALYHRRSVTLRNNITRPKEMLLATVASPGFRGWGGGKADQYGLLFLPCPLPTLFSDFHSTPFCFLLFLPVLLPIRVANSVRRKYGTSFPSPQPFPFPSPPFLPFPFLPLSPSPPP